jgi:hypothetical protein
VEQNLDPHHRLDEWEIVLYFMALSFLIEGTSRFFAP